MGVRQGECLSPFLFSMYVNDLEREFQLKGGEGIDIGMLKIFLLLYADDITIFASSAEELQTNLNMLSEYCSRNKLIVNTSKTKIMVFRRGGILPRDLKFYYNNIELSIVSTLSYLGIVFSTGGSFSECHKTLAGQALKAIFKLNRYLYNFTNITPRHRLELFDKLVTPILNYGSEVWGFGQTKQIERIHRLFCKQLLGVKTATQNDFVYGELGRTNYYTRRIYIIIKYWFKVIYADERKYISQIYNVMLNDIADRQNIQNWASLVRNTLANLGFFEVWLAQGVGDMNKFLLILKQRLADNFLQNWSERLEASSRASFYKHICIFQFQPCLDKVVTRKFRVALSKLRLSSHRLLIESGRWNRPQPIPREQRLCAICNYLEDEYHLLFECSLYNNERVGFLKPYYLRRKSMFKAVELMQSSNAKVLKNLAVYIYKCFEIRNAALLNNNSY